MGAGNVFLGAANAVFSVVDVVHVLMYPLYFATASRANVFLWCHWSFRVDILGATGLDGLEALPSVAPSSSFVTRTAITSFSQIVPSI